jgi:hypothetical protein
LTPDDAANLAGRGAVWVDMCKLAVASTLTEEELAARLGCWTLPIGTWGVGQWPRGRTAPRQGRAPRTIISALTWARCDMAAPLKPHSPKQQREIDRKAKQDAKRNKRRVVREANRTMLPRVGK